MGIFTESLNLNSECESNKDITDRHYKKQQNHFQGPTEMFHAGAWLHSLSVINLRTP